MGVLPELVKGRVVVRGEVNRGVNVISLAEIHFSKADMQVFAINLAKRNDRSVALVPQEN